MSPITNIRRNQVQLTKIHLALLALIAVSTIMWVINQALSTTTTLSPNNSKKCLVSHGTYAGSIYTKSTEEKTLENKCLVESPWMRLAQHTVQLPNNGKVIDDWLWIDYHDRINVLVEAPRSNTASDSQTQEEQRFMIMEQTKYALDGMSLAVVGGIIEPKEEATMAAQREVNEELAVTCQSWKTLGKFRTDVNRGMGWVHPFLATNCQYTSSLDNTNQDNNNANPDEVGGHDTEKQHVQMMTLQEVKDAVIDGKFVEVQWSNTVALAMLHLS